MNELILTLLTFATSTLTAISGSGGGLLLLALMPGLLPSSALIPVHAATQLISNSSRAALAWRTIMWSFVPAFLAGSLIGGFLGAQVIDRINTDYLPLLIAAFILWNVWGAGLRFVRGEFFTIGLLQTGLSMLIGTTGPLGQSALVNKGVSRDSNVSTTALFMTLTHALKLVFFGWIGFSFAEYGLLMLSMSTAAVLGSWLGTQLRHLIPDANFQTGVKWLLTFLAARMVFQVFFA